MKKIALCVSVCILFSMLFVHYAPANASRPRTLLAIAPPYGTPLFVKADGGDSADCSSWATACSLQRALSLAVSGDQVWVAAGTYTPTDGSDRLATFTLKPGVEIYGGFPAGGGDWDWRDPESNFTLLSGDLNGDDRDDPANISENSYHVITGSGVDNTAVLDGFTISGGNANGSYPDSCGGGMFNNSGSPTLSNVTFSGNSATVDGGGMYNCFNSSPTLSYVTFSDNTSQDGGGGIYNDTSNPILSNVTFSNNKATYVGGGMFNYYSDPVLDDVTFSGNSSGHGGGMCNNTSNPILSYVTFSGNWADDGGGMYNEENSPTLTNVTFSDNSATSGGGGMFNYDSYPVLDNVTFSGNSSDDGGGMLSDISSPKLTNVTFSGNSSDYGGGMYNYDSDTILNGVTFSGNSSVHGGGIRNDLSSPILVNTILWGNTPDQIDNDATSSPAVSYSDIQGDEVYPGTGNINQDPLLSPLADNGGFTLTHALGLGSPAIDAGNPGNCPLTDQRGFPRPIDGDEVDGLRCDMGAYEYGSALFLYLPLILK